MNDFNLEDFRPLDNLIKKTRSTVRELMDSHFSKIDHDEERKIIEMRYFLKTFDFIRKKWNVEILYELEIHKGMNFNELTRHLEGISSRSLSDSLKELENLNFITRSVQDERPPKVFYELTEKGKGFIELSQFIIMYLVGI
ncbi:MAG: winged helix-turn-helix transcriptional regulator [Promethearchaeota archaeon]